MAGQARGAAAQAPHSPAWRVPRAPWRVGGAGPAAAGARAEAGVSGGRGGWQGACTRTVWANPGLWLDAGCADPPGVMATAVPKAAGGSYTFASQPRAVPQRKKYRETTSQQGQDVTSSGRAINIMHDPRVVRGNTYRQVRATVRLTPQAEEEEEGRKEGRKRKKE